MARQGPLARLRAMLHAEGVADEGFDDESSKRRRPGGGRGCAAAAWPCPTPGRTRSSPTSTPSRIRCSRRSGRPTPQYLADFDEEALMATMSLGRALNAGLRQAMERDPKVVLMGEDIGKLGGVFRVTEGLQRDFGDRRVIDTPLAESGVIGTAVGLAMRGYRPVCEIQFDGFVYPAFDQIVSQVAKLHYRTEGRVRHAGDHPRALRRRRRRGRAPLRVAGGLLRPHGRAARRDAEQRRRRAPDDPAGHRVRRPGRLLRAEAPLLGEGRGRRGIVAVGPAAAPGPRGGRGDRR